MAVTTIAVAGLAVSAYGANSTAQAGKKGAKAIGTAADRDRMEQQRQFDITNANYEPFRQTGVKALGRQEDVLNGDYSGFMNSPDFLWARDQGLQAADRGAAAGGGYRSGGADADRMQFASGLATQNLNNYWAKLAGQADQGYSATGQLATYGQELANRNGAGAMTAATARASSYQQGANAWANFGQDALRTGTSWARQQGYY